MDAVADLRPDDLTAVDTERMVARIEEREKSAANPGAPVVRRKFALKSGSVMFTFRKRDVTDDDLLAAVTEVKAQIQERNGDPADFD